VRNATSTADAYENSQSNGSIAFPISGSSPSTPPPTPPPTGGVLTLVSVTADKPAPQPAGSAITFTATASGGTSPYQYKWWIYDGTSWISMQQWTTSNRWTWTPGSPNSASRVAVWVRNAGSTADAYDNAGSNGSIPYPISSGSSGPSTPPPPPSTPSGSVLTLTTISADRVAPQPVGTPVTFTASAQGGSAPYQYKWWTFDGANWIARREWSTSNTWTWTPTAANSSNRVAVWVRNAGSTADTYDNPAANGSIAFAIMAGGTSSPSSGPLRLNGISPSRSAPSPAGAAVTFTASISGGTGPQQFKWWVYDGTTWIAMTGWSTSNSWTWAPPAANSLLRVSVWVRNAGSTADTYANSQSNGSIAFPVF
jgi:N-acetylmuramoyl-L-alanine amidase